MSTQEMTQLVDKLNKEREDHEESIKKLTLTELRAKVSRKSRTYRIWLISVESEVLYPETENERRASQWCQVYKILEGIRNWQWLFHGASYYETENARPLDNVESSAACTSLRKVLQQLSETVQLYRPGIWLPTGIRNRRHVLALQGDPCDSEAQVRWVGHVPIKVWDRAKRASGP